MVSILIFFGIGLGIPGLLLIDSASLGTAYPGSYTLPARCVIFLKGSGLFVGSNIV